MTTENRLSTQVLLLSAKQMGLVCIKACPLVLFETSEKLAPRQLMFYRDDESPDAGSTSRHQLLWHRGSSADRRIFHAAGLLDSACLKQPYTPVMIEIMLASTVTMTTVVNIMQHYGFRQSPVVLWC
ncbi:unnamed protein product [Protopolystoma xenopodis]|uniref:Uncharacterized protein n=1 Tax=Protopolystoma xenopodis TaxID=117903 RepID=A0A448WY60_9PLAT|nr:unnamed protein product [Protopolystoma xenopodis]